MIWAITVACGTAESRPRRMVIDFIFTWDQVVRKCRAEGLDEVVVKRGGREIAETGTYF